MVSEDRVRALFDAVMAKLSSTQRDAKSGGVAWMERLELLVVSGALGWVLGETGDRLRAGLALHGIELPEAVPAMQCEKCGGGGVLCGDDYEPVPCSGCTVRAAAAAVPVGEWSATPPDKPGDYYWRERKGEIAMPCRVYHDKLYKYVCAINGRFGSLEAWGGEWWTIPIQPPGA